MFRLGTFVLALLLAASLDAEAATKAIRFGKLWDGHRTIANAVVVVEDDKIQSVTANGRIPAGAETIDLSRFTGIPGLIDSHTHMTFYWDRTSGTNPLPQPPRHVAVTRVFRAGEREEDARSRASPRCATSTASTAPILPCAISSAWAR